LPVGQRHSFTVSNKVFAGDFMNSLKLNSGTIALLVVALLVGGVGLYTENNGFVVAGAIFLVVAVITAVNQLRGKN
jgi:hypothetical protein